VVRIKLVAISVIVLAVFLNPNQTFNQIEFRILYCQKTYNY
jgi:hypothetical protein